VRKLWREFTSFAMSGNMLDLALAFLIGTAFATLVQSLANNVLMQFVAAIFGQRDFTALHQTINGADIKYGAFLTDLLNFGMLAVVMFALIKLVIRVGIARSRSFDTKQCPYCYTEVPPKALVCKWCCQQLVDELPSLAEAHRLAQEAQARRLLPIPVPLRRRDTTYADTTYADTTDDDTTDDDTTYDDLTGSENTGNDTGHPQALTNGADRRK
jgi:large conductance mechanosensitive channel